MLACSLALARAEWLAEQWARVVRACEAHEEGEGGVNGILATSPSMNIQGGKPKRWQCNWANNGKQRIWFHCVTPAELYRHFSLLNYRAMKLFLLVKTVGNPFIPGVQVKDWWCMREREREIYIFFFFLLKPPLPFSSWVKRPTSPVHKMAGMFNKPGGPPEAGGGGAASKPPPLELTHFSWLHSGFGKAWNCSLFQPFSSQTFIQLSRVL